MILSLKVDTEQLYKDLDGFTSSMKQLTSPKVLDEISRAIFSITSKRFMIDVDRYARINPKKMHHIYEWGKIGNSNARLFVLERSSILDGSFSVSSKFLSSKMPVPIKPELLTPGKTGKSVSRRSVFANKASVMEEGNPVSFNAKRVLAFVGNEGVAFIAPGTQINILHPGGIQTKNALGAYMLEWYSKNINAIMDSSGLYERISNDVSVVLNSNKPNVTQVQKAVKMIADQIDEGSIAK
jgi:hypothetical protein